MTITSKALPTSTLFALALGVSALSCASDDSGPGDEDPPSCEEDTRDETYVAGISKIGSASYTIAIMDSNPAPPAKGDNVWTIEIRDSGGAPMPGLLVNTTSYMPDHGHGSPIIADVAEVGDGVYTLNPVNLFMPGYWEITLTAVDPGATDSPDDDLDLDSAMFKFCIEG
jgi:hypothetical protein